MPRSFPSFASLRAFEAVGRTLSFTGAAEELSISQAAVSRQVRALDDVLGVVLLERGHRHNELTLAGQALHGPLRESFDRIDEAVRAVSTRLGPTIVTISVAPFFSSVWLTPRIMSFREQNPDVDPRLHHAYAPPDYRRDQVDLGINWGSGAWSGVTSTKLLDGAMAPVHAPTVRVSLPLDRPGDLAKHRLLYEFSPEDWLAWFARAGDVDTTMTEMIRIGDTHALRRAALDGQGCALVSTALFKDDLETGRLVQPFDMTVDTGDHYFLNYPADRPLSAAAKRFRRWLMSEIEREGSVA